jgi:UDP-N-acetylmuramoyl-tripeptide--D-alanyl-D-alanine ligase
MEIIKGQRNITLIDDCYNANPISMKAALGLLKDLKAKRKIAVLGEMAELGKETLNAHLEVGKIAKLATDQVYGVGKWAKRYQGRKWFPSAEVAAEFLLNEIKPGDIILIKGSRKVGLEKVVEALRV